MIFKTIHKVCSYCLCGINTVRSCRWHLTPHCNLEFMEHSLGFYLIVIFMTALRGRYYCWSFTEEKIKAQKEANVIWLLSVVTRMEIYWPQELSFLAIIIFMPTKQTAVLMKIFSPPFRFHYELPCFRPIHLMLTVVQYGKKTNVIIQIMYNIWKVVEVLHNIIFYSGFNSFLAATEYEQITSLCWRLVSGFVSTFMEFAGLPRLPTILKQL